MKVLVISDIHSNLEALEAVVSHSGVERGEIDLVYNLGDLVGYGANPNEVIGRLRGLPCPVVSVAGNHDYAAVTGSVEDFNAHAAEAALWTRKQLSPENLLFLSKLPHTLPYTLENLKFYLVHGSPRDPLNEYVFPTRGGKSLFEAFIGETGADVLLLGHTHIPMLFEDLGPRRAKLLNPGSVGQSRDGINKAGYAVLEVDGGAVRVRGPVRVAYDIERAARKILQAGLPEVLAMRLYFGQ